MVSTCGCKIRISVIWRLHQFSQISHSKLKTLIQNLLEFKLLQSISSCHIQTFHVFLGHMTRYQDVLMNYLELKMKSRGSLIMLILRSSEIMKMLVG